MKIFFLTYTLILLCILGTFAVLYFLSLWIPNILDSFYYVKSSLNFRKSVKDEEEDFNEVIDDSFTTQELAEVERFRARLDALRKDKDGLYDVHNVRFDNFTGVETSE